MKSYQEDNSATESKQESTDQEDKSSYIILPNATSDLELEQTETEEDAGVNLAATGVPRIVPRIDCTW